MDWKDAVKGTLFAFVLVFIVSLFLFAFSSKQHNGYYLHSMHGESKIYINWENYPDEVAFRTFNEKEALDTLERLNKQKGETMVTENLGKLQITFNPPADLKRKFDEACRKNGTSKTQVLIDCMEQYVEDTLNGEI